MGNGFEEAMHQGFSAAEMAQEAQEQMARVNSLGCLSCLYRDRNAAICGRIIEDDDLYSKCPYRKEV